MFNIRRYKNHLKFFYLSRSSIRYTAFAAAASRKLRLQRHAATTALAIMSNIGTLYIGRRRRYARNEMAITELASFSALKYEFRRRR